MCANFPNSRKKMFNRFRSAFAHVVGGIAAIPHPSEQSNNVDLLVEKYVYSRPEFLGLSESELCVSSDHIARPILVPRDISRLPWNSGYAETINAGKSKLNEDQAAAEVFEVQTVDNHVSLAGLTTGSFLSNRIHKQRYMPTKSPSVECGRTSECISVTYFGLFDGHAGAGAALMAVNTLHAHIQERLSSVLHLIIADQEGADIPDEDDILKGGVAATKVDTDDLVTGALEMAFCAMDEQIGRERTTYKILGGCTALVAVFLLGKVYVANAGDSRAVLFHDGDIHAMSRDFTPESERQRLQLLACLQPELLKDDFTPLEFQRRVHKKDIGKRMLYRDAQMAGWAYRQITEEDTKFPLIYGEGKRNFHSRFSSNPDCFQTRVLATIGVTRGFGDHDLRVYDSQIHVKPFLTPMPEVRIFDLMKPDMCADDVLIMACDGLWDVISNEAAVNIVQNALNQRGSDDPWRYVFAAQELVLHARGQLKGKNWKMLERAVDWPASSDDISAFVVPLYFHAQEISLLQEEELSVLQITVPTPKKGQFLEPSWH